MSDMCRMLLTDIIDLGNLANVVKADPILLNLVLIRGQLVKRILLHLLIWYLIHLLVAIVILRSIIRVSSRFYYGGCGSIDKGIGWDDVQCACKRTLNGLEVVGHIVLAGWLPLSFQTALPGLRSGDTSLLIQNDRWVSPIMQWRLLRLVKRLLLAAAEDLIALARLSTPALIALISLWLETLMLRHGFTCHFVALILQKETTQLFWLLGARLRTILHILFSFVDIERI